MNDLKRYLLTTPESKIIYTDKELHPLLKNKIRADICHEVDWNMSTGETKEYFVLFINKKMIVNSIKTDFPVPESKESEIAKLMIEEFKSYCDFSDLDKELEGKCACDKYADTYTKCDECPLYIYGQRRKKRCMSGSDIRYSAAY